MKQIHFYCIDASFFIPCKNELYTDNYAVLFLTVLFLHLLGIWGILRKAERSPWSAFVPAWKFVELNRVANVSLWWLLVILVNV